MRHATARAVCLVAGEEDVFPGGIRACDWAAASYAEFTASDALDLIRGNPCDLPSCPACGAFIDAALLIRAEAEQAKYDAEREAEKRGAA